VCQLRQKVLSKLAPSPTIQHDIEQAGNPMPDKLEEIRQELERLRHTIDKDGFKGSF